MSTFYLPPFIRPLNIAIFSKCTFRGASDKLRSNQQPYRDRLKKQATLVEKFIDHPRTGCPHRVHGTGSDSDNACQPHSSIHVLYTHSTRNVLNGKDPSKSRRDLAPQLDLFHLIKRKIRKNKFDTATWLPSHVLACALRHPMNAQPCSPIPPRILCRRSVVVNCDQRNASACYGENINTFPKINFIPKNASGHFCKATSS